MGSMAAQVRPSRPLRFPPRHPSRDSVPECNLCLRGLEELNQRHGPRRRQNHLYPTVIARTNVQDGGGLRLRARTMPDNHKVPPFPIDSSRQPERRCVPAPAHQTCQRAPAAPRGPSHTASSSREIRCCCAACACQSVWRARPATLPPAPPQFKKQPVLISNNVHTTIARDRKERSVILTFSRKVLVSAMTWVSASANRTACDPLSRASISSTQTFTQPEHPPGTSRTHVSTRGQMQSSQAGNIRSMSISCDSCTHLC